MSINFNHTPYDSEEEPNQNGLSEIHNEIIKNLSEKKNITEINRYLFKKISLISDKERGKTNNIFSVYLKKTVDTDQFTNDMFSAFIKEGFSLSPKSLTPNQWRILSAKLYKNETFAIYKYAKPKNKQKSSHMAFLKKLLGIPILFKAQMVAQNWDSSCDIKLGSQELFKLLFKNPILFNITAKSENYSLKEVKVFAQNISVLLDFLKEKKLLEDPSFKELHEYIKTPAAKQIILKMLDLKTSRMFHQNMCLEDDVKEEIVPYFSSMIEKKYMENSLDFTKNNSPSTKKRL